MDCGDVSPDQMAKTGGVKINVYLGPTSFRQEEEALQFPHGLLEDSGLL